MFKEIKYRKISRCCDEELTGLFEQLSVCPHCEEECTVYYEPPVDITLSQLDELGPPPDTKPDPNQLKLDL